MRTRQPTQLDVRSIFDAAFVAREEVPELFMAFLADQFVPDGWHEQEEWAWHASKLSSCDRQLAYDMLKTEREPLRTESQLTFDIGKFYHALLQFGLAVHPDYELLGHEIGGIADNRLAARGDVLFRFEDVVILVDLKTEGTNAGKYRRAEAKRRERKTTVKPEHELQVSATAKVLSAAGYPAIDEAWVLYVDKDSGDVDQQPVLLDGDDVDHRLADLEDMRQTVIMFGTLPERQPDDYWGCRPRSESDGRGLYCPFRWKCKGNSE